jgi:hypothetical protein
MRQRNSAVERPYKSRTISASGAATDCTSFVVVSTDPVVIDCPYDPGVRTRMTTHLGRNTATGSGVTRIQVFPTIPCVDYLGRPAVVSSTSTDNVIVAADGSELFSHAEWTSCFSDEAGGNVAGTFTFTGGTGRFEGATGGGSFESFLAEPGALSTSTSVATITY